MGAVLGVILLGISFWGGMTYAKGRSPVRGNFSFGQGAQGGQFMGRTGAAAGAAARGGMGGLTAGQIIAKDDTSITVKMADGSTKIVLVGASTAVSRQAQGSASDLTVGADVAVQGSANSDGSVTAQSVQIRPMGAAARQ